MIFWKFYGEPISLNPSLFPTISTYPEVSVKVFVNSKLEWLSFCYTNILLYSCGGCMRYLNRFILGNTMVLCIYLTL